MNWAGDYLSCLQRRENPHAVPAATRLLEQNSIATKSEGARFDKFFWRPRDFFDRESLRIVRAAEFFHGTNYAHGLAWKTDERAEIEERRVINAGRALGRE